VTPFSSGRIGEPFDMVISGICGFGKYRLFLHKILPSPYSVLGIPVVI
jgi:hypothetical protein